MSNRRNIEDIYPLSPMQQGMLFHALYDSGSGVYDAQWTCTLYGYLHISAFKHAWQHMLERHAVLRTAFNWTQRSEPFQVVYRHVDLPWREYDWRQVSLADQELQLEAFLRADRQQSFELDQAPLTRLSLLRLAEEVHQFIWSFHHLLLDGWSLALLLQDVFQLYEALCKRREVPLIFRRPYGDYISWLQEQSLSAAENFWKQTLKDFTVPTSLGVKRGTSSAASNEDGGFGEQEMRLSATSTTALWELARQHHLSMNTLVQAAWGLLLSRYSGQKDVVFGATVSGRTADLEGVESMIGLFINTLPVRVQVTSDAWLLPWLQALQAQQGQAYQFEYSPLVQVKEWSEVPRGLPLFESILVFENYPRDASLLARGQSLNIRHVRWVSRAHYPLTVVVLPGPELELRISYTCRDFDTATIRRMSEHLKTLLESMGTDPKRRLVDIPWLSQSERQHLLTVWNNTQWEYPRDTCVHHLCEAQAARTQDAVALLFEGQAMTYRQLNARANRLAYYLQTLGVGPEVAVGICIERSFDMVVGVLAILKAGGAYVPLDPGYPLERCAFMLSDAAIGVLVTQQKFAAHFTRAGLSSVCIDTAWDSLASQRDDNPCSGVTPENLAYVMYTSGSTGAPKGVMVPHRALSQHMSWMQTTFPLTATDRVMQKTSISFDASVWEMFASLSTGGQLIIARPYGHQDSTYLVDLLATHHITVLKLVPSLLQVLLEEAAFEKCQHLKHIFCGGEALSTALQERCLACLNASLHNFYGPTEATIDVTYWTCEPGAQLNRVPIGRPITNTQIYLLDASTRPIPIGVPGELNIGGDSLARGYLNRPQLTAERFIPDPFSHKPGARLYRTGDEARYLPDGIIEFLGRLDRQVKMRGYRIELGEIETILQQHPSIKQAVVVAREDTPDDRRLVAYIVTHHEPEPGIDELRHFLQAKLPAYMIPEMFVAIESVPLTSTGKVNYRELPAPGRERPALSRALMSPQTSIEEILVGIWETVLGIESVGVHDNFFELGGHSLLAVQVISRLRHVLEIAVPLRELFDAPTVASLARRIAEMPRSPQTVPVPPIQLVSRQKPVPLTITQEHFWDLDRLLPGAPFSNMPYAMHVTGTLNVAALEQSFNEIIKRHEALRTTFTTVEGHHVQVIAPALHLSLMVEDLRPLPQSEREDEARRRTRQAALYPFDLTNGPLLLVRLLRLDVHEYILLLTMHHIISDGWSMGILCRELALLYGAFDHGCPASLPPLPMQYADFAHWQRQCLHSEWGNAQLAYWRRQLSGPLPRLELPTDRPRTGELSLHTARQTFHLSQELSAALKCLSRREGTTLFMTLVAAFKVLLHSYTGQEEIRVSTLAANRQRQEIEGVIGLFTNLVILRTKMSGNLTLREVLRRVRTTTLEAYMHQELPFEYLVRTLEHEHQLDRLQLFQVMFTMQHDRQWSLQLPELTTHVLETHPIAASTCDMAISVRQSSHGLDGLCTYKPMLFDAMTINRILDVFQGILECLIDYPEKRLSVLTPVQNGQGKTRTR